MVAPLAGRGRRPRRPRPRHLFGLVLVHRGRGQELDRARLAVVKHLGVGQPVVFEEIKESAIEVSRIL